MSYTERRTLTNIFTITLILVAYAVYAFPRLSIEGSLRPWAGVMLTFVGISILASVVIQVLFHVIFSIRVSVKEAVKNPSPNGEGIEDALQQELVEDERDKLIELKSTRAGSVTTGVGLIAGLVALLLDFSPAVMLNIIFISFFLGMIAESIANLILYQKSDIHV